ncbi:hypothetical protein [Nocardia stercoris]|uniref:Uncharacterized protein n=1 Tax=Nocardia stercoris TaxID=2483361 RepID=A0A3M2KQH7_9NOCA|nr:hypothetical protein [Nocardia stercoris]RMI27719.1 hypothetical protein EBN03_33155 [Nocardia stercoris]
MNKKKLTAAVAGAAVAGILSAGQAQANVPAFAAPFVDPGCLCGGLLPAPIEVGVDADQFPVQHYLDGNFSAANPDAAAEVRYFTAPTGAISILELGDMADDVFGSVTYGSYRGHPSFTTAVAENDHGVYLQSTVLVAGSRVIILTGSGYSAADAVGSLTTLSNTFLVL